MFKKLMSIEVGFLKINDIFYCDGQQYKILILGDRDINNVCCKNLETDRIEWFDVSSEVEVLEE